MIVNNGNGSKLFRIQPAFFLEESSLGLSPFQSCPYLGRYLLHWWHPIHPQLGKNQFVIEAHFECPSWGYFVLKHVESEVASQKDEHSFILDPLIQGMVSYSWNEVAPHSDPQKGHLQHRNSLAQHWPRSWKGILRPDHQYLRMQKSQLLLKILEGLFISSARAILNHHRDCLPISSSCFLLFRNLCFLVNSVSWDGMNGRIYSVDFISLG